MLEKEEINEIIVDIEVGLTNYAIAKKYKHSPNTIKNIRKDYNETKEKKEEAKQEEEENIDVDALNEMDTQMKYETGVSPTRAVIEKEKAEKHSKRVIEEAEEIVGKEEAIYDKARRLIEAEERQKIIDEYDKGVIQPRFDYVYPYTNSTWYTREMVNKLIEPFSEKIVALEGQINQLKTNHDTEIIQLTTKHTNEIEQTKVQASNEAYLKGIAEGDQVNCYSCGRPLSKSHLLIPCPSCFRAGWTLHMQ